MTRNEEIMESNLAVLLKVRQKQGLKSTGYAEKYREDTMKVIKRIHKFKGVDRWCSACLAIDSHMCESCGSNITSGQFHTEGKCEVCIHLSPFQKVKKNKIKKH